MWNMALISTHGYVSLGHISAFMLKLGRVRQKHLHAIQICPAHFELSPSQEAGTRREDCLTVDNFLLRDK